jgi:hypothetical protein
MDITKYAINKWKADNVVKYTSRMVHNSIEKTSRQILFTIALNGTYRITFGQRVVYHGPSLDDALETYNTMSRDC